MTTFEALTLIVALLAIALSLYTLAEQRRLQREANDLQRATAELAKRQIADLQEQEKLRLKARVGVDIVEDGRSHRLRIWNFGSCDAYDVDLDIIDRAQPASFLSSQDAADKLPVKRINPGSSVTILCSVYTDTPPSFDGTLSWKNPDGTQSAEEFTVFIP